MTLTIHRAVVTAARRLTPGMARITLGEIGRAHV